MTEVRSTTPFDSAGLTEGAPVPEVVRLPEWGDNRVGQSLHEAQARHDLTLAQLEQLRDQQSELKRQQYEADQAADDAMQELLAINDELQRSLQRLDGHASAMLEAMDQAREASDEQRDNLTKAHAISHSCKEEAVSLQHEIQQGTKQLRELELYSIEMRERREADGTEYTAISEELGKLAARIEQYNQLKEIDPVPAVFQSRHSPQSVEDPHDWQLIASEATVSVDVPLPPTSPPMIGKQVEDSEPTECTAVSAPKPRDIRGTKGISVVSA